MNKGRIAGGGLAAAMIIAVGFIGSREGVSLDSYLDVAGVYTVCYGHAYTQPGSKFTKEDCDIILKSDIAKHMTAVRNGLKVDVSPQQLAAFTSLDFNVGSAAFRNSTALRLTNQGKPKEGCEAILKWKFVGKKDCSISANKCSGIWSRRIAEKNLCLSGVGE